MRDELRVQLVELPTFALVFRQHDLFRKGPQKKRGSFGVPGKPDPGCRENFFDGVHLIAIYFTQNTEESLPHTECLRTNGTSWVDIAGLHVKSLTRPVSLNF